MINFLFTLLFICSVSILSAQTLSGRVLEKGVPVPFASLKIESLGKRALTDSVGLYTFSDIPTGKYLVEVSAVGYSKLSQSVELSSTDTLKTFDFQVKAQPANLNEVVVTGTLKQVSRLESAVPVEVFSNSFFRKNPTPSIFDALQNINGVRPQLNCNVCNTGDIHINGLEGPYTMVMIDGMPIVSSLSTVYGLSGIPNSLIERVEIIKGPASSLYGSEAVGGLINIITRSPNTASAFSADVFSTNWAELNADLGLRFRTKNASVLTGLNYFNYQNPVDKNSDNFTDVTLQHRISVFQKWTFDRSENRVFSLAGRYFYEDRWGGDKSWTKQHRGGDLKYGESIYTNRFELLGLYQLPFKEKTNLSFSYNYHDQNSVYGTTPFSASQHVMFGQLTWDKRLNSHDLLLGIANRTTHYADNSLAEYRESKSTFLPGAFIQDEIKLHDKHTILLGFRYDYNSNHGSIYTPRLAYKLKTDENTVFRLNAGTGFRVVNVFTEDHAALTGSREVVISERLQPEKSFNVNLNMLKKVFTKRNDGITLDVTAWITRFNNRIMPDYDSDPNKIIYKNLQGFAISKGISANIDYLFAGGAKALLGATILDVYSEENGIKERQLLTEPWMGTWSISYPLSKILIADYTGNIYGPMQLPVLGELDPRRRTSPVWSIQNIQLTFSGFKKLEIYGGVKNLLNWTPERGNPFLIARSDDPFDKNVQFDSSGQVIATPTNPYALTFDPTYMFAPNQGRRVFLGLRYTLK